MQQNALRELYKMEAKVKSTKDQVIISDFRKLQTSDHFYYMCTKWFSDGDVHKYFNPYNTPYEAYINFMNVLDNLNSRCRQVLQQREQESKNIPIRQTLADRNVRALSDSNKLSRAEKPIT
jgi:alpha-amylase